MVTLDQKKEQVAALVSKIQNANAFYLVDFTGMTVAESIKIRRDLKKESIEFKVAKNTLIKRALDETGKNIIPDEHFKGQSAVLFAYDDVVVPARMLKEQQDKNGKLKLKAAVLEGIFYPGSELKTLAALPSKKDLMAGIVGSLHAPISGIVGSINAVMRDLASLIEEVAKKRA